MKTFFQKWLIYSLFLLIFASCAQRAEPVDMEDCLLEQSPYDLAESYFGEEDTVTLLVRFIKFNPEVGGMSVDTQRVYKAFEGLNAKFLPAKIQFKLLEIVEILDTDAYTHIKDFKFHILSFKKTTRRTYKLPAIDVFIYPPSPEFYPGAALGIPSDALFIQNHMIYSSTLIHEMGHVLGLHHTHSGNGNGYDKGDYICDLPNVNPITNLIDANCAYRGLTQLSDEEMKEVIENYMTYSRKECRVAFTSDQIDRMRTTIEKYPILIEKIIL